MNIVKSIFKTNKKSIISKIVKSSFVIGLACSLFSSNFVWAVDAMPEPTTWDKPWSQCQDNTYKSMGYTIWKTGDPKCKVTSFLQQYEQYAPTLQQWPSYNPGGFDCRTLIGTSTTQGYQSITVTPYHQKKSDGDATGDYWTERPSMISFQVDDPDHDYKACLVYQTMNQWLHTKGLSSTTNFLGNNVGDHGFFGYNSTRSGIAKWGQPATSGGNSNLQNLHDNPMYWEDDYLAAGVTPFNLVNDGKQNPGSADFIKWFYYMAIAQQNNDIYDAFLAKDNSTASMAASSIISASVFGSKPKLRDRSYAFSDTLNQRLWSDLMLPTQGDGTSGGGMFGSVKIDGSTNTNPLASTFLGDEPFSQDNATPWLKLEDWLGYGSDLQMFSSTLDVGNLFKNGGKPNFGKNGSLQVGFDPTQPYGSDKPGSAGSEKAVKLISDIDIKKGFGDKGLLTTRTTITVSKGLTKAFTDALTSGDGYLNGRYKTDLDFGNWKIDEGSNPDWGDFIITVLNSGIQAATKGISSGVIGYTAGSGFYNGDSFGMLLGSNGKHVWTHDTNLKWAQALCSLKGYSSADAKNCKIQKMGEGDDGTTYALTYKGGERVIPALGNPLCGYPQKDDKNFTPPAGVTEPSLTTKDGALNWPLNYPSQPFGNGGCYELYNLLTSSGASPAYNPVAFKGAGGALLPTNTPKITSGELSFKPVTAIFGGPDFKSSNASWWNIGKSYLIVNQMLAQNVQRLVNAINSILYNSGLSSGIRAYMQPFIDGKKGFKVKVDQTLKFSVKFSGGINGTLNLTYVPASKVSEVKSLITGVPTPSTQKSVSLDSPLSRNFLLLAVQNKPFTTTNNGDTLSATSGISSDVKTLMTEIQGLPDNLARPLEYYAMYYRAAYPDTAGDWQGKMKADKYQDFYKGLNHMMQTLVKNNLATNDLSNSSEDKSAFMFSSINSALSSIYAHITPQDISGGGASGFINPQKIEDDLQQIYAFGDASGETGSSAKKMIGKQYDFLTQIQQLGVHMIGDVVDNIYQIGNSYTNVFNSNTAMINNNLSDTMNDSLGVQQYSNATSQYARNIMQQNPTPNLSHEKNVIKGLTIARTATVGLGVGLGVAQAAGAAKFAGSGPGSMDLVESAGAAGDAIGMAADIYNSTIQEKVLEHANTMLDLQNKISLSGVIATNKMLNVQHKQLELTQMSYQMMVNMTKSMMLLPLAFVVLTMLFTAGMQFALIIPMTPYIIFWAGQTSWLINTIEAMVAAPLVGLAIVHPGGHSYYGHGVQAYKMLINVVLKPVLLVFGTMASMILVYIIVVYSAQGFHTMGNSIVGTFLTFNYGKNPDGTYQNFDRVTNVRAIMSLMLIFMYATFLTMVFNKCFSVIYLIPEKVVQWVGGQSDNFGKEAAQHLAQATQQETGQVAQAGQQSTQSIAGGSKEMSSSKGQSASSQEGTGLQMAGSSKGNSEAEGSQAGISSSKASNAEGQSKAGSETGHGSASSMAGRGVVKGEE